MLRLFYTPMSPFARKVRVAAIELGLHEQIELVEADVWGEDHQFEAHAPLGQVPVLTGGPEVFPGSTLICDYLDSLSAGATLTPSDPREKWRALSCHALADGIMAAAVAHTVERLRRPTERQWPDWLLRQEGKIARALAKLEADSPGYDLVHLGTVALGCALTYLDRRLPHLNWRDDHPNLSAWLDGFEQRRSMTMTQYPAAST